MYVCMIKHLYYMHQNTLNLKLELCISQRDDRTFYSHRVTALLLLDRMEKLEGEYQTDSLQPFKD